ncbi:MAG: glycerophosphodiester phosphodiesterase [Acidimicrobiales bacterium]|nr:glycerophosphodiester phosphodiesterase [Acidimicrobiales bacterium]
MQQRLPSLRNPAIQFAHRGARANAPENTLEAFELALRLGATGLETDVWITSDGVPVLDHDGVVRTGIRRKSISKTFRVGLPDHVPSLEELYRACGADFELSIDVKDTNAISRVIGLARDYQAEARLWLCHPTWELLADLRSETSARLVNSTRLKHMKDGPERRAAELAAAGIDAVNLHHSDWSGGLTTLFHRFNRYCIAWDAQHVRVIRDLVRMGIDGVHSDHVDRLQTGFVQAD